MTQPHLLLVSFLAPPAGNKYFRKLVQEKAPIYRKCQKSGDRIGTLTVVQDIVEGVGLNGGRFMMVNFRNKVRRVAYPRRMPPQTDRWTNDQYS